ncbi:RNase P/MRP, p29 subunit [Cylindrobasidium torrendii FP15055 ss-10]|uniref:RNase P/MRP, p29 subunit n=1 Tax=Cylindrobasidium torrendii FP15055 ss-10 TaxID=1314674 RepID=A0A0D7BBC3_9AGAR|nr:RNase P/MRP, p29 subunit [Cylindrobasidium torrendii FP15055 ss-10]
MSSANKNQINIYKPYPAAGPSDASTSFTADYVKSNLTTASDPAEVYASRVHGRKIVLENPLKDSRSKKERAERRARHKANQEKKRASIAKRKEGKIVWKLDEAQRKFELFRPLHHLWMGYMSELLGLQQTPSPPRAPTPRDMPSSSTMHPKLLKADMHGALLTVQQSKNPSLVGISGIVLHETENTFAIIMATNAVKLIPKAKSIFTLPIPLYSTLPVSVPPTVDNTVGTVLDRPHMAFDLHGNQFCFRSTDRAGRKFKHKETVEL